MKSKKSTILGVALSLMLVFTLSLAAPVSADELEWSDFDVPDEIEDEVDITSMCVAADGETIYVVDGESDRLFKSTDAGVSWSDYTDELMADVAAFDNWTVDELFMVYVAADNADIVAVVGTDNNTGWHVAASDDGAENWDDLDAAGLAGVALINYMVVSREKSGEYTIAIAGSTDATPNATEAEVWAFEYPEFGEEWDQLSLDDGYEDGYQVSALGFSPNFAGDEILIAISVHEDGATDNLCLQLYSFNLDAWNEDAGELDYQNGVVIDSDIGQVDGGDGQLDPATEGVHAALSLAPDYLGDDPVTRVAFLGLTIPTDTERSGIWRLDDDSIDEVRDDENVWSVAYNGENLVAGETGGTTVWRCDDPLDSSPSVSSVSSYKDPGGEDSVIVAWAGDTAVAGTSGDDSAFAVSTDNGKSFNDISLIDLDPMVVDGPDIGQVEDLAVSGDGSIVYLVTSDNTGDLSLWRYESSWQRVLSVLDETGYLVRIAPDDPDAVYLADEGATRIYYSSDGGTERWRPRSCSKVVQDLAVEGSGDVVYVIEAASGDVDVSVNTGFTWGDAGNDVLEGDGGYSLVCIGEGLLIAGGDSSAIAYSSDAGDTWDELDGSDDVPSAGTNDNVMVIASGLADGDFIYAVTSEAGDMVYQWELGVDDEEWKDISEPLVTDNGTDAAGSGIVLVNGMVYVVASDGVNESVLVRYDDPSTADPEEEELIYTTIADNLTFSDTPRALVASTGTSITLWALSTTTAEIYEYTDTVAVGMAIPTLSEPADGTTVDINPVTGDADDTRVMLRWTEPSGEADAYEIEIALDADFEGKVFDYDLDDDDTYLLTGAGSPTDSAGRSMTYEQGKTYYWRVKVDEPVDSGWSATRSFTLTEAESVLAPVTVTPPAVTVQPPEITVEAPAAPQVTVAPPQVTVQAPPAAAAAPAVPNWALLTIIIIGAVLLIGVIVLIVRTRRVA